ncbi:MAG TPA: exodeoxyribonuclease III [Alphaproteobacteria bacterium]|nr:exodeoxyribonuclease III [Alphaproteobacteria bacterium]
MVVKIATWNVNSVKARLPNVLAWLKEAQPDVVMLQEIKCVDEAFPRLEIEELGYNLAIHGQKTYNGVAILSKGPLEDVRCGLPHLEENGVDDHARYVEAVTTFGDLVLRVASIYLPNGNPSGQPPEISEKYAYKLKWMDRLRSHAKELLAQEEPMVLAGDYNVIPTADDVWEPEAWRTDALFRLETREKFRALLALGLTDAFKALHPMETHCYTFWDYQAGAWPKDHGIRIDHLLLSPQAADRLTACQIDKKPRGQEKASDHTPIWCELA